jgi:transposase-like protein
MKTQISKPACSKASYTDDYKQQALELWRASGRSAAKVAAELGIGPPLLYCWARTERPASNSGPAGAEAASKRGRTGGGDPAFAEQNAKLLEQREVLTKSLGILSEVPPRGMPGSNR